MKTEKFNKGVCIFAEDDYSEEAYKIIEGRVEISINEGGVAIVLGIVGVGQIFGEMGMIERLPRSAAAYALEDVTVEVINEEDFNQSLLKGGEVLVPYLTTIFERLRLMNERLHSAYGELAALRDPAAIKRGVPRNPVIESSNKVLLHPDSDETRSQSALKSQAITSFPFVLGRRADLAACVDVFSKARLLIGDHMPFRVSRSHCAIEHEKGAYFIQDRGSQLGTIVNGIEIGGSAKENRVNLQVGTNTLVLGPSNSDICFTVTVPEAK